MIESKVYGLRRSADRRYGVVPQCDSQCVGCELCPRGSADTRRGKKTRRRAGSRRKSDALRVVLIGVPNCGKTTLLNALTGSRLRTGNCPGVTVGESAVRSGEITYIDLPGVYSLSPSGSEGADESEVARRRLYGGGYDAVMCVADASAPERSLGLAVRLSAAGIPFVLAMNMADTARKKGVRTDAAALSAALRARVVEVSALRREGLDELRAAVAATAREAAAGWRTDTAAHTETRTDAPAAAQLDSHISRKTDSRPSPRPFPRIDDAFAMTDAEAGERVRRLAQSAVTRAGGEDIDSAPPPSLSDKADALFLHPAAGPAALLVVTAAAIALALAAGRAAGAAASYAAAAVSRAASAALSAAGLPGAVVSLIADGAVGGASAVVSFLPAVAALFCVLGALDDSGLLARFAAAADPLFSRLGMSGRAVLPLLLGWGCTVPAILSCRTLKSERDRRRVCFALAYMTCPARLPVYLTLAAMFFSPAAVAVIYAAGAALALLALALTKPRGEKAPGSTLFIELPPYRIPDARTVLTGALSRTLEFLSRAGTIIFAASALVWFLVRFGAGGYVADASESFGYALGRLLSPLLSAAGLGDPGIALSLFSGFAAKESTVSTLTVLFGPALAASLEAVGFGRAEAAAMAAFTLTASPCVAAVAAAVRERGALFAILCAAAQTAVAIALSAAVYAVFS